MIHTIIVHGILFDDLIGFKIDNFIHINRHIILRNFESRSTLGRKLLFNMFIENISLSMRKTRWLLLQVFSLSYLVISNSYYGIRNRAYKLFKI